MLTLCVYYDLTDQLDDGVGLEVDIAVEREQKRVPGSNVLLSLREAIVGLKHVAFKTET